MSKFHKLKAHALQWNWKHCTPVTHLLAHKHYVNHMWTHIHGHILHFMWWKYNIGNKIMYEINTFPKRNHHFLWSPKDDEIPLQIIAVYRKDYKTDQKFYPRYVTPLCETQCTDVVIGEELHSSKLNKLKVVVGPQYQFEERTRNIPYHVHVPAFNTS